MHFKQALSAALLLAFSAISAAGPVQQFLDRFARQEKLPGAVLLVSGPQGREVAVTGVASLKTREPVTPQTRFYIASSGKLVTAAATLQLVQERKLALADRVFPVVQSIAGITKLRNVQQVTLEQLLTHRSGLAEYYDDDFQAEVDAHPGKIYSADESLAWAFGKKAQSRPGREHDYTNTNYVLLGRVIELADGTGYAQSVQRRIFDAVGMPATTIGARSTEPDLAHGYTEGDNGRLKDVSYTGWNAVTGDGAVVTTAGDYELFLRALFRDGKLLPQRVVRQMCRAPAEEPDSGYGLGCSIEETPWGEAWGHNGSISGFNADTWYIPKLDVTVVFMTNGDYEAEDVVERAVKAYLRK